MTLTSEEICAAIVPARSGTPDQCGLKHRPAQRVFVRRLPNGIIEQVSLGIYCLDCGIRLEENDG